MKFISTHPVSITNYPTYANVEVWGGFYGAP